MDNRIYVSTNAFVNKELKNILYCCEENGITNIELSLCSSYGEQEYEALIEFHQKKGFNFLLHNYFPPPSKPFVMNLASEDEDILKLSREHCRKAIQLSFELGATFYCVHAGHCYHSQPADLGKKLDRYDLFPKDKAKKIFNESLRQLSDYALEYKITIAIENHILCPFHLIDGKNELLLGVAAEDIIDIINSAQRNNISAVVDVGHLKGSSLTLGFCPHKFIHDVAPYIIAFHLSDNNGYEDEHSRIHGSSWFWDTIKKYRCEDTHFTLEINSCSVENIHEQLSIIKAKLL